jgi:hypothetical protein
VLVRAALDLAVAARGGADALPAPLRRCVRLADEWLRELEPPAPAQIGPRYLEEVARRNACEPVEPVRPARDGGARAPCVQGVDFGCGPGRRQLWVRGTRCRGAFRCAWSTKEVHCGYGGHATAQGPHVVRICNCL